MFNFSPARKMQTTKFHFAWNCKQMWSSEKERCRLHLFAYLYFFSRSRKTQQLNENLTFRQSVSVNFSLHPRCKLTKSTSQLRKEEMKMWSTIIFSRPFSLAKLSGFSRGLNFVSLRTIYYALSIDFRLKIHLTSWICILDHCVQW